MVQLQNMIKKKTNFAKPNKYQITQYGEKFFHYIVVSHLLLFK